MFYSYTKRKSKTISFIGSLRTEEGTYAYDSQEVSEVLKKQYNSVFSELKIILKINNPDDFSGNSRLHTADVITMPQAFQRVLGGMPIHSSPGPDSYNFLKKCKSPLTQALNIH